MSDNLFNHLKSALREKYKVVILSGAGVSTNAGIPDYRSGNRYLLNFLTSPMSEEQFYSDPRFNEILSLFENSQPTLSHHLAKELHDQGLLLRVYTQNIDGLYQKAGLPEDMVVEFHGSAFKKNIVRMDDDIPNDVIEKLYDDFSTPQPVVMLVMGTSLQVNPFACIPNLAPKRSIRVLVGHGVEKIGAYKGSYRETGISSYVPPTTFSFWRTTFVHPENPSLNQHKKIKRCVRGKLEWGWGSHTRSTKKWSDYRFEGDVDEFSRELLAKRN